MNIEYVKCGLRKLLRDERGVTAIEYGLLAAMVGLAIAPLMPTFSQAFRDTYTSIGNAL